MDFFKLNKGEEAVVRFLFTDVAKIPTVKVHNVAVTLNGKKMNQPYKCLTKDCPLCEKYPKEEYIKVVALYDYTDKQVKCWKTTSKALISSIETSQRDWDKPLNQIVFKLKRENDEYGSYSAAVMPEKNYPYPTEKLEVELDTDVTFRFGMYRSADEMRQYLATGVMPKHVKVEKTDTEANKAKVESVAESVSYTPPKAPSATYPNDFIPGMSTSAPQTMQKAPTFEPSDEDFQLPF